jgi:hypothetical protein
MKRFLVVIILTVAALWGNVTTSAQEIDATVIVNMDQLQMDDRFQLQTMQADVQRYLNSQLYSGYIWDAPKIPVSVTIWINSKAGDTYSARIAVVSSRLVNNDPAKTSPLFRIFDQEWRFAYTFNPTLTYQTLRYDPFTSLLDFYMLIAVGMDADTYDDLAGSLAFQNAKQIAGMGNSLGISGFSTTFKPGEITRMAIVTELSDPRFEPFRRYVYDYQFGLDEFEFDQEKGRQLILGTLESIVSFKRLNISNRSTLLQLFFDAKAGEIADIFRGQKDSPVWEMVKYLDPGNTQMYEAARTGQ